MILALILMLSPADVDYGLTGVIVNKTGNGLVYKTQDVTPANVALQKRGIGADDFGIFYDSKSAKTNYEGGVEFEISCRVGTKKYTGAYRFSFLVARDSQGSCTYRGDAQCQSRCAVEIDPKSCGDDTDCHPTFTYTIGSRR